jgi:arsenate reductase
MAEALMQSIDQSLEVYSASMDPVSETDPVAIEVMKEAGIDISQKKPLNYREYEGMQVDYLITLCDGTKSKTGSTGIQARHKIHLGFEDPRNENITENQIIEIYRDVRDEIRNELEYFCNRILEVGLLPE